MPMTTLISADKVRAYMATSYRLCITEDDIIVNLGQPSSGLAELFAHHGVTCGAILTAFNPRGVRQADEANELRHTRLGARLAELRLPTVEGSGTEVGSAWGAEKSYFAFGLDLPTAQCLGQEFDQDALFWLGTDATAQLIFLR